MRRPRAIAIAAALCLLPLASPGQGPVVPSKTELAPGIFLFSRPGYGDVGLDGNSIAIVGRDTVLVFDTNGTPASAANVLAEIDQGQCGFAGIFGLQRHGFGGKSNLQRIRHDRQTSSNTK